MILLLLILPLLSNLFFVNRLTGMVGIYLNLFVYFILVSILGGLYASSSVVIVADAFNFVRIHNIFDANFSFCLDGLSLGLLVPVVLISSLVQLYSVYYMENDPSKVRFISYLNFFSLFMIMLVMSDNLLCLFLGGHSQSRS